MVAADNADMRAYISDLLAPRFDVLTVANGQAAVETIARGPPGLVLSDVTMPDLDGYGLLRAIRSRPEWRALPVILMRSEIRRSASIAAA